MSIYLLNADPPIDLHSSNHPLSNIQPAVFEPVHYLKSKCKSFFRLPSTDPMQALHHRKHLKKISHRSPCSSSNNNTHLHTTQNARFVAFLPHVALERFKSSNFAICLHLPCDGFNNSRFDLVSRSIVDVNRVHLNAYRFTYASVGIMTACSILASTSFLA